MVKRQGWVLGVAVGAFVGVIGAGIMMPRQTTRIAEAKTSSPYWERASNGTVYYKEGGVAVKQGVPVSSVCPGNAGYSFFNDGCYDTGMFSTGDGDLRLYSNRSMVMKLASNGRVGIGTTSPESTLHVVGGVRARGGEPGPYGNNQNGYAFAGSSGDNDSGMFSSADGTLDFYTDNSRRMRITNGDICIGTGC